MLAGLQKPEPLDNFGEVSFSTVFDITKDYFSELHYTQSDFPCESRFLSPGDQKRVKDELKIRHIQ